MNESVPVVRASIAPLLREPRVGSEQVSQCLVGMPLARLEIQGSWMRVQVPDGYVGWMHAGYTETMDAGEAERRSGAARTSLGCTVLRARSQHVALPLGALLAPDDVVESGCALAPDALRARFPRDASRTAAAAQELFAGTPYQWGGITPWGADCSGMVQAVFALHGIRLPRDASQQADAGIAVPCETRALRPGDLRFFAEHGDGRVTHVGIVTAGSRMVHVALGRGGFAEDDLAAPDDPYARALAGRWCATRRLHGPASAQ